MRSSIKTKKGENVYFEGRKQGFDKISDMLRAGFPPARE
jgi:hypothetical protein